VFAQVVVSGLGVNNRKSVSAGRASEDTLKSVTIRRGVFFILAVVYGL
jgi:hypothetical protein